MSGLLAREQSNQKSNKQNRFLASNLQRMCMRVITTRSDVKIQMRAHGFCMRNLR